MTIEIQRRKSIHQYRISPDDARNIDRRENKFNARWYFYARRDTANEAKVALLSLERPDPSPGAAAQDGGTR